MAILLALKSLLVAAHFDFFSFRLTMLTLFLFPVPRFSNHLFCEMVFFAFATVVNMSGRKV